MSNKDKTATEYFEILKSKKQKADQGDMDKFYENALHLLNKYKLTNQVDGMKKLMFHIDSIEKERQGIEQGIDTFVYKKDIQTYIESVKGKVIKSIELERYEREIPDEVVDSYLKVKDVFDSFFVLFTDYTGEHEKKHMKEKDPILFGMFHNKEKSSISERMYFIGDWEDEYCDLTLDKLVTEMENIKNINIQESISTPTNIDDIREYLKGLEATQSKEFVITSKLTKNKSFFSKVKTFLTGKE